MMIGLLHYFLGFIGGLLAGLAWPTARYLFFNGPSVIRLRGKDEDREMTKIRNYDPITAEGLAFALLGCLDFGPEGKSLPTFRPEAIRIIQQALEKARDAPIATEHAVDYLSRGRRPLL